MVHEWANILTGEPEWVLKFDRWVGIGPDGCSVLATHLIRGMNGLCGKWDLNVN